MKKQLKIFIVVLCMLLLAPGCGSPKEDADRNATTQKPVEEDASKAFAEKETAVGGEDSAREDENKNKDGKNPQSDTPKNKGDNAQNPDKADGKSDTLTDGSSSSNAASNKKAAKKFGGTGKGKTASRHIGQKSASQENGSSQSKGSSQSAPARKDEPEKKTITVTILVDCKTAVEKGDSVAEAISSAGTIFGTRSITLKKDATVYDALKKTGLVIGSSTSGMGVYVYSIQSLAENACGPGSGWLYSVNGKFHQTSCSNYRLKDGDKIQWRYTCNNGKDM